MRAYSIPISLLGAALIAAGGLAYLIGDEPGWGAYLNLGLGALIVVVMGVLNPALFRQYGLWLNAVWGSAMVLGIVGLVNYLADQHPKRLDLTEAGLHSLSDLSVATVERLDQDVRALGFMEKGGDERLESLLKAYAVHGSRFSFELINVDDEPDRAAEYGIRQYNTLVIEAGDNRQQVTELTEKEVTNGILKAIRDRHDVVYLTAGHGEKILGAGEFDFGLVEARLQEIDYSVRDSLFLARSVNVPSDCAVLLIAGPQTPFLQMELDAIREYMEEGGSVLVFLDPLQESGLEDLLQSRGVVVGDDFVIDTSGIGSLFGLDFTAPVAAKYGEHPITRKHHGLMTFFQLVRSVELADVNSGTVLVSTSAQGWAESDLEVLQGKGRRTVRLDEVDRQGPVSLGVATGGEGSGGRLVVFGDSDFASNFYFNQQGNGDLALNAISWLAEDESLISIRPREAGFNPIALTESQADWIFWISVIVYPALVALIGLVVVSRKGRWSVRDLAAAGLGTVLSLGVIFLVNYLGESYHYRLDLTEDELFTLSPETHDLLEPLEERGRFVKVKAFSSELFAVRYGEVLDEYSYLSRNFDYEILDPQQHSLEVKQYDIRDRGTSIIEVTGGGKLRVERITEQSEEALSNAIQRALRAEDYKVYFSAGHGEGRLEDVDGEGYSILKGRLKEMNYEVDPELMIGPEGVPIDATVLAVLAPRSRFSDREVEAIGSYLGSGGSGLFLLDPGIDTGLESLLAEYAIGLGQDFVVDASGLGKFLLGADVSVPVVTQYGEHPITERIQGGVMSFYPWARTVRSIPARERNPETASLLFSHASSWAESDLAPLRGGQAVSFDAGADQQGPLSLALAVSADPDSGAATGLRSRLVVFGDADFARNQYFGEQANGQLLASSISWLAEGEDKLSISPKQARHSPISLAGGEASTLLWTSVFLLPFAIALSGLVMMLRRGYETYADGFVSWLTYTFFGSAVFYFATAVIHLSEEELLGGQGYLLLALASGAVGWALFRRHLEFWWLALSLAILNVGIGFAAIPVETVQWLHAALFTVNGAVLVILVWVKKAFSNSSAHAG